MTDIHDASLASRAESYIMEQKRGQRDQRSTTNSQQYQEYKQRMEARYGND